MAEVAFPGLPGFSDAGASAALLRFMRGPPYPYRMVITDAMIRVEGRGRTLRAILPSRSCALDKVCSARQRGTLVILYLPDDEWLTFPSLTKCRQIMSELKSRGVPTTQDA